MKQKQTLLWFKSSTISRRQSLQFLMSPTNKVPDFFSPVSRSVCCKVTLAKVQPSEGELKFKNYQIVCFEGSLQ
jgi:hypothetical protein